MNGKQTEKAEKIIGYAFKNKTLLERAFIHSSYANENNVESYERLEFLGDGVLGLIVAELLYERSGDEGVMTVRRSRIVSSGPLEDATEKMGLDEFIQYGKGERMQDHTDSKVHADVFEAVLGAIYLDGGYERAVAFVTRHLGDAISRAVSSPQINHKGILQEYCQADKLGGVEYTLVSEEERDGRPYFVSRVSAGGVTATGEGRRKRDAEQEAAKSALEKLRKRPQ